MDSLQLLKIILSDKGIQSTLNSGNFEDAYEAIYDENIKIASTGDENIIPLFTEILYGAGIDPLKYLKNIPGYFAANSKKVSFDIPDNIETIGNFAFGNCENLKNIKLPNSLISIGASAFAYCKNLKSITIPKSCNKIGNYCFLDCTNLEDVVIESPNVKIGMHCFSRCNKVKNVTYIGTFKNLGSRIFDFPMTFDITFHCSDGTYSYDNHYNLQKT